MAVESLTNSARTSQEEGLAPALLSCVLRGVLFDLLRALITTNRDLFAGHSHFDAAIVDRPITDRTFARVH